MMVFYREGSRALLSVLARPAAKVRADLDAEAAAAKRSSVAAAFARRAVVGAVLEPSGNFDAAAPTLIVRLVGVDGTRTF